MSRAGRGAATLLLVAASLAMGPRPAHAQAVPAAYGLISGTVAGIFVTTGIFVTKARTGSYIYSLEDALAVRWELIPVAVMPLGSVAVGLDDGQRLANSLKWGGAGFAAGAALGLGLGTLLKDTGGSGSQWAGAIIGSAAGLLAGSLYGVLSYDGDDEDGRAMPTGGMQILTVSIPL